MNNSYRIIGLITLSVFIAFYLSMLILPDSIKWLRPNFVALILIYWLLRSPEQLGVRFAWMLGLMLDGVEGAFLGQHALAFSLIAYVVLTRYQQLRMFSLVQQALFVFALLCLDQMIANWVYIMVRGGDGSLLSLTGALLAALIWPTMTLVLNRYPLFMGGVNR